MPKKITLALLIFILGIFSNPLWAGEPVITAEAAVLIDADTGKLIYGKNHTESRPPASITKILTAIIGIEKGELDDIVEISTRASQTGEASLNLRTGERITLKNLLYGALLKSGNDTCVAIAEYVAPTVEDFVNLMNFKAKVLGCYNTNFVNTNGLPAKNHYSTAYDLALIARYALTNSIFAEIVATPSYTVTWEDSIRKKTINNTNKLLTTYAGASGIKTGTTDEAGYCLIASANRENQNLIAVVLKSQNRFRDARVLLDYGFNNYRNINVIDANRIINYRNPTNNSKLALYTVNNLLVTIDTREKVNITSNLELDWGKLTRNLIKDEVVGRAKFFNNGIEIGSVPLSTVEEININTRRPSLLSEILQQIKGKINKRDYSME